MVEQRGGVLLPLELRLPAPAGFYGGREISLMLANGLTTFVGPNGSGKTSVLRPIVDALRQYGIYHPRFLSSGRMGPAEPYRSNTIGQGISGGVNVGQQWLMNNRWNTESIVGDFMALMDRPDLLIKVEARLETLFGRRVSLRWTQNGIEPSFS